MKKCALFLAEGYEECEALITVDLLRRANVEIDTFSITSDEYVKSSHAIVVKADKLWSEFNRNDYDVLILPGGKLGTANLEKFEPLINAIKEHYKEGKLLAAICAAPSIYGHLGLLKDKKYTCFPTFDELSFEGDYQEELAVYDDGIVTGRGMGATIEFARTLVKILTNGEMTDNVDYGIQYEHRFHDLKK